jgi:hypothetical protein
LDSASQLESYMALQQDVQQAVQPDDTNENSSTPVHDNHNEKPFFSKSEFRMAMVSVLLLVTLLQF